MNASGKFCQHCGTPLEPEARFCGECGQPIAAEAPPAPQPEAVEKAAEKAPEPKPAPQPEAVPKAEPKKEEVKKAPPREKPKRKKKIFLFRTGVLIPLLVILILAALAVWWPFKTAVGSITALALSPDGQKIAAAADTDVRVWNISDPTQVKILPSLSLPVRALVFHPQDNILAGMDEGGRVVLWDLGYENITEDIPARTEGAPLGIAFSPDGKSLLGMARVAAPEKTPLRINPGVRLVNQAKDNLNALFSGRSFWLGENPLQPGGGLEFWDIRKMSQLGRIEIEDVVADALVTSIAFNAEGSILAYGTTLGQVAFWDLWGKRLYRSVDVGPTASGNAGSDVQVRCLAFNEAGNKVVAVTGTRLLSWTLWDMKLIHDLDLKHGPYARAVIALVTDTAANSAILGWSDGRVELWDLEKGAPTAAFGFVEGLKKSIDTLTRILKPKS
jgi:WD40 repeat protein